MLIIIFLNKYCMFLYTIISKFPKLKHYINYYYVSDDLKTIATNFIILSIE